MLTVNVVHSFPPEFTGALARIAKALDTLVIVGVSIMNDLSKLEAAVTDLEAKVTETNATLAGLAQAVIDLKASGDVQAGIDALETRAKAVLASLAAAEDAADDQLPPTPPTP